MKLFLVLIAGAAVVSQTNAGPIWDRAKKMFGWDKPEDFNQNVAFSPHYHQGGSHGYQGGGQAPKGSQYGPRGPPAPPPGSYPNHNSGPPSYGPRPDLQHASSAPFGSFAASSFSGPSYAKAPLNVPSFGGYPGLQGSASSAPSFMHGPSGSGHGLNSFGGAPDFGAAPSAANNYGGLFSVVDQTSHIGQLANGDLAASPSEPYASNEDVMKSLLKMVDKPFDLETAASASHYFNQKPQHAINPGPHPIMEADRNVIRYRTSPIQIGVADTYSQHQTGGHTSSGLPSIAFGHQGSFDHSSIYGPDSAYGSPGASPGSLGSVYGDLHTAASSAHQKKSPAPKTQ